MYPTGTTRRQFLAAMAATLAAGCTSGSVPVSSTSDTTSSAPTTEPPPPPIQRLKVPPVHVPETVFSLGVASGSPTLNSILIWTRLMEVTGAETSGVWELAEDSGFSVLTATGKFTSIAKFAHSAHVDVSGLNPATTYWYRFLVGEAVSPTGTTRTLPGPDISPPSTRLGVSSCQHLEAGHYGAHRDMAATDLDLVVWLGDFIYEYVLGSDLDGRAHTGGECQTLDDYRARYAQYRSDPHLQANSAAHPWVVTWDDHEVENDYEPGHDPDRQAAAYQAWWENMPVRLAPPTADGLEIHTSVQLGELVNLVVPDCRQEAGEEHIISSEQFEWLEAELSRPAVWTVLASSLLVSGTGLPGLDTNSLAYTWAGYPADRSRLAATLAAIPNALIVSGDLHTSMDLDFLVDYELGAEPVAREIMAPAISSRFLDEYADLAPLLPLVSATVNYVQVDNGWLELVFTASECKPTFHFVADVANPESPIELVPRPPLTAR